MKNTKASNADMDKICLVQSRYCQCFSNEKRLRILYLLKKQELSVGEIAEKTQLSPQNVSQHLRVMKDRMVVSSRKDGQTIYYRIANTKFVHGCDLILEGLKEELAKKKTSLDGIES